MRPTDHKIILLVRAGVQRDEEKQGEVSRGETLTLGRPRRAGSGWYTGASGRKSRLMPYSTTVLAPMISTTSTSTPYLPQHARTF